MNRVFTLSTISSALALIVFLASEIGIVAVATVWSLVGLLHLGPIPAGVLSLIVGLPCLFAIGKLSVLAFSAETDPENL
jgi:hypothetical protein